MGMGMGWGGACVTVPWKENTRISRHVLPLHGRTTQGQADMRRDMGMGMGMGRGGACATVPWKENTRTSRHVKRYGDGKGMGWGMCYPSMEGEHKGDGVGWGICYRAMEGEHKDKQTCEEIWG